MKIFTLNFLLFLSLISYSQVSYRVGIEAKEFEFLPYKGERLLAGDLIEVNNTENIIIFSKPKSGITPDTLYIQHFIKKNDKWSNILQENISSNNTVSLFYKKKSFQDDNKSNLFTFYGFSEDDLNSKERKYVGLLIIYKGKLYTIKEDNKKNMHKSKNYKKLPKKLSQSVDEYWVNFDNKWNQK